MSHPHPGRMRERGGEVVDYPGELPMSSGPPRETSVRLPVSTPGLRRPEPPAPRGSAASGRSHALGGPRGADSYQVRYWTYHPQATGVVVFIHGFRGDHHGLELIARSLPGRRVIIPDLPAFGESSPLPGSHDLAGYTEFLAQFLASFGFDSPPDLLGHSFGSIICAAYARSHPEGVRRLVLVNPIASPALDGPRGVGSRIAAGYYRIGADLPARAGDAWLRSRLVVWITSRALTKTRDPSLRAYIDSQHRAYFGSFHDRRSLLEAFRTSISHTAAEHCDRLRLPTLLLAGELDDIAPLPAQRRFAAALPDARLVVLEGTGHLIHYERPREAAAAIEQFLS